MSTRRRPTISGAAPRAAPKFHRQSATLRREALVKATLHCLKLHGHEGVSVRRISAAAGVSIGLINHHFPSKSALVAEAYETLALSLQESTRLQANNRAASARSKLTGFFRASFAPESLDPQLFNVWLVFWSMVAHSPQMRAVHDRTYGKYRAMLESLLGELSPSEQAPPFKLRPAAIALSALLDGLWVELSLGRATFSPREAVALCEDWVGALCLGAFPRLLKTRPTAARLRRASPATRFKRGARAG